VKQAVDHTSISVLSVRTEGGPWSAVGRTKVIDGKLFSIPIQVEELGGTDGYHNPR
jgi:hypothetical protein